MDGESLRGEEPAADIALVRGALLAEREEPFVNHRPLGRALGLCGRGLGLGLRGEVLSDDEPREGAR